MTKQEKVDFVITKLKQLYPEIPIPLDHKDPYTLLIAVLMSAQSTDVRVNQITPLLFDRADNPYDMIKLSVEEIREIIKGNVIICEMFYNLFLEYIALHKMIENNIRKESLTCERVVGQHGERVGT